MAKRPQPNAVASAHAGRTVPSGSSRRVGPFDAAALVGGLGVLLAAGAVVLGWPQGCAHQPPPGAEPSSTLEGNARRLANWPGDGGIESPGAQPTAATASEEVALVGAIIFAAPIYSGMEALRDKRIGYIRQGSKAPAYVAPIRAPNCEAGWFHLVGDGYVCAKFATLDLNNPLVRLGTSPPNLDDPLPYRYVRNATMGTPLYRSVPSRGQMLQYEPYLRTPPPKPRPREEPAPGVRAAESDNPYAAEDDNPYVTAVEPPPAAPIGEQKMTEFDFGKSDLKLSDLSEGPDSIIGRRLVRGFYVAVDKAFNWNNRDWYKTTFALVAPADRFTPASPSMLQGVELAGSDPTLPVGFVLSSRASKYEVDPDKRQVVSAGSIQQFAAARLTGREAELATGVYRETAEGWWMKATESTYTHPGPPPSGLGDGEKWIDVNLSRQSLVAFEGTVPVYATLVASGKKAADPSDKLHDRQTVQGAFRIREKHVSMTMDGDGPAPGDMPYSIEDVPYVMYFEGSYALHAAFWHSNFGHETSHGCVNLAPLDAKRLFNWAEPALPQGWHGVIAAKDHPGTRVVVHE
jgi:hypothetical protein